MRRILDEDLVFAEGSQSLLPVRKACVFQCSVIIGNIQRGQVLISDAKQEIENLTGLLCKARDIHLEQDLYKRSDNNPHLEAQLCPRDSHTIPTQRNLLHIK